MATRQPGLEQVNVIAFTAVGAAAELASTANASAALPVSAFPASSEVTFACVCFGDSGFGALSFPEFFRVCSWTVFAMSPPDCVHIQPDCGLPRSDCRGGDVCALLAPLIAMPHGRSRRRTTT